MDSPNATEDLAVAFESLPIATAESCLAWAPVPTANELVPKAFACDPNALLF